MWFWLWTIVVIAICWHAVISINIREFQTMYMLFLQKHNCNITQMLVKLRINDILFSYIIPRLTKLTNLTNCILTTFSDCIYLQTHQNLPELDSPVSGCVATSSSRTAQSSPSSPTSIIHRTDSSDSEQSDTVRVIKFMKKSKKSSSCDNSPKDRASGFNNNILSEQINALRVNKSPSRNDCDQKRFIDINFAIRDIHEQSSNIIANIDSPTLLAMLKESSNIMANIDSSMLGDMHEQSGKNIDSPESGIINAGTSSPSSSSSELSTSPHISANNSPLKQAD